MSTPSRTPASRGPREQTAAGGTVLVYASDPAVREQVRMALGRRPAPDVGRISYVEAGSHPEVLAALDAGGVDVCLLDGEAWPAGGMGLARQVKFEYDPAPACLVLTGRRDDRWIATWSLADAVLQHPLDPVALRHLVAGLLRRTQRGLYGAGVEAGLPAGMSAANRDATGRLPPAP